MDIIVIVAIAKNFCIGKDNDIPWRLKEDFQHFKEKTMGHPCIMGDKTFESLPDNAKPLPGRENIVLTFDKNYRPEGTTVFHDFDEALKYCDDKGEEKVFICGGATIYKIGMQKANMLELTIIDKEIEGDTFFPKIDLDEWELSEKKERSGINKLTGEKLDFSFNTYRKKEK